MASPKSDMNLFSPPRNKGSPSSGKNVPPRTTPLMIVCFPVFPGTGLPASMKFASSCMIHTMSEAPSSQSWRRRAACASHDSENSTTSASPSSMWPYANAIASGALWFEICSHFHVRARRLHSVLRSGSFADNARRAIPKRIHSQKSDFGHASRSYASARANSAIRSRTSRGRLSITHYKPSPHISTSEKSRENFACQAGTP